MESAKIYKICSEQGPLVYFGCTTKKYLSQRMASHRTNYKKWKEGKFNNVESFRLFDAYGVENCKIELLETVELISKIKERERYYIDNFDCVNKNIPGRSKQEYNLEYNKKYYLEHKEDINKKSKEYFKNWIVKNKDKMKETHICECGGKYCLAGKSSHIKTKKHQNFINPPNDEIEV